MLERSEGRSALELELSWPRDEDAALRVELLVGLRKFESLITVLLLVDFPSGDIDAAKLYLDGLLVIADIFCYLLCNSA